MCHSIEHGGAGRRAGQCRFLSWVGTHIQCHEIVYSMISWVSWPSVPLSCLGLCFGGPLYTWDHLQCPLWITLTQLASTTIIHWRSFVNTSLCMSHNAMNRIDWLILIVSYSYNIIITEQIGFASSSGITALLPYWNEPSLPTWCFSTTEKYSYPPK